LSDGIADAESGRQSRPEKEPNGWSRFEHGRISPRLSILSAILDFLIRPRRPRELSEFHSGCQSAVVATGPGLKFDVRISLSRCPVSDSARPGVSESENKTGTNRRRTTRIRILRKRRVESAAGRGRR
jgi:hypothetical protein